MFQHFSAFHTQPHDDTSVKTLKKRKWVFLLNESSTSFQTQPANSVCIICAFNISTNQDMKTREPARDDCSYSELPLLFYFGLSFPSAVALFGVTIELQKGEELQMSQHNIKQMLNIHDIRFHLQITNMNAQKMGIIEWTCMHVSKMYVSQCQTFLLPCVLFPTSEAKWCLEETRCVSSHLISAL